MQETLVVMMVVSFALLRLALPVVLLLLVGAWLGDRSINPQEPGSSGP